MGVAFRPESYKWSVIQGLISRGDRRISHVLEKVSGYGDSLGCFRRAFKDLKGKIPPLEYYVFEDWPIDSVLPWGHIRTRSHRRKFWKPGRMPRSILDRILRSTPGYECSEIFIFAKTGLLKKRTHDEWQRGKNVPHGIALLGLSKDIHLQNIRQVNSNLDSIILTQSYSRRCRTTTSSAPRTHQWSSSVHLLYSYFHHKALRPSQC